MVKSLYKYCWKPYTIFLTIVRIVPQNINIKMASSTNTETGPKIDTRNHKFECEEIETLVVNVQANKELLLGSFSSTMTTKSKELEAKWVEITQKINAHNVASPRT